MEYTTNNWTSATDVVGTNIDISSIIPAAGGGPVTLKVRVKAGPGPEQSLTINARPAYAGGALTIDYANEATNQAPPAYCGEYSTKADMSGSTTGKRRCET
jgi:hypothetical protein